MVARVIRLLYASMALTLLPAMALVGLLAVGSCASRSQAAGQQDQVSRIKDKAERVKAGVKERGRAGEDVSAMQELMRQVRPNMQERNFDEVESLLDQVLAMLGEGSGEATSTVSTTAPGRPVATVAMIPITVQQDPGPPGGFDPSIQYGPDGEVGWMVFSALGNVVRSVNPLIDSIVVAKSTDHGRSWSFVQIINHARDETRTIGGERLSGIMKYEVPTLVYHPEDRGREWKLYANKMFWAPRDNKTISVDGVTYAYKGNRHSEGLITYRYASDPAGDWSEELVLVANSRKTSAIVDPRELSRDFKKVKGFSEPGSLSKDGTLYLTLTAYTPPRNEDRFIFLMSSRDGGESWEYVGKLLTMEDAKPFGYELLKASDLAEENGRVFLIVSPSDRSVNYGGAMVFEFEDLSRGKLKRDGAGNLVLVKHVRPPEYLSRHGAGPATYDPANTNGGIVMSLLDDTGGKPVWRLYDTGARLAD